MLGVFIIYFQIYLAAPFGGNSHACKIQIHHTHTYILLDRDTSYYNTQLYMILDHDTSCWVLYLIKIYSGNDMTKKIYIRMKYYT